MTGPCIVDCLRYGVDEFLPAPTKSDDFALRLTLNSARLEDQVRGQATLTKGLTNTCCSGNTDCSESHPLPIAVITVNANGIVTASNQCAVALGLEPNSGIPWSYALGLEEGDRRRVEAIMAGQQPRAAKVTVTFTTLRGERRQAVIEAVQDAANPSGHLLVVRPQCGRDGADGLHRFGGLVGCSPAIREVIRDAARAAASDLPLLIEGETGVGKEVLARSIWQASARKSGPFLAFNCAGPTESLLESQLFGHAKGSFTGALAMRPGLFEAAEGGVVFLDEIGDMPMSLQVRLLRVLEQWEIVRVGESIPRKLNVRVIAAAQHDLADLVKQGTFRADLFYRLRVVRIRMPSLRERREDIPLLAREILADCKHDGPPPPLAKEALLNVCDYDWPGNVRELRSALQDALTRVGTNIEIGLEHFPLEVRRARKVSSPEQDIEWHQIEAALREARGNRTKAATALGISRSTLYRRIRTAKHTRESQ